MTNLKNLTDHELDVAALVAAKNERLALVVVLEHLAEVDLRKSFSPRFDSLEAYIVGHLGYDSKSAWRRVSALRLMQELPEIAPAIESGKLDLTKIALAQSHFRNEAKAAQMSPVKSATISFADFLAEPPGGNTPATHGPNGIAPNVAPTISSLTKAEKIEILNSVMAVSSREAQRNLISKSSASEKLKRPDFVKPLSCQSNEVRLVLSDEDLATLQKLKDLLAHKIPKASLSEIVSVALEEAVLAIEKERSGGNKKRPAARESVRPDDNLVEASVLEKVDKAERTRRPGAVLKRKVWSRAEGKCEICGSCFALEYDHLVPFAKGGKTTFENLRLACRNCNQRESIKIFGPRTVRCREVFYDPGAVDVTAAGGAENKSAAGRRFAL